MRKLFKSLLAISLLATMSSCAQKVEQEDKLQPEAPVVQEEQPIYFYLVRHGQTMFNAREVMQGWCDSPLTEKGINQAKGLGAGLADVDFTIAYTSVSERAKDTAEYALGEGRNVDLVLSEEFKEFNFGELEATPNAEAWAKVTDYQTLSFHEFGGENIIDVATRATGKLNEIAEEYKYQGGNILVASHGMTIGSVIFAYGNEEQQKIAQTQSDTNCSVTIAKYYKGEWTLETVYDISYRDNGLAKLGIVLE